MDFTQSNFYQKVGVKKWLFGIHEAVYFLREIPYAADSTELFIKVDPYFDPEELENSDIISWDLLTIAKSALCFYLVCNMNGRQIGSKKRYVSYDVRYAARLILNKYISIDVISMLNMFYFCPHKIKIAGVKGALQLISSYSFSRLQISTESLNNLLLFLDIDQSCRDILIQKTFEDLDFKQIVDFLTTLEFSVNKNLLLTEILLVYKKELKTQKLSLIQLQKEMDRLFDLALVDLESFDFFDIFDSTEQAKSGSSKISFYSFYQELLLSLTQELKNEEDISIKIFELFELFLYSAKNKTIFLVEIGFDTGNTIQKFIVEFCKVYFLELQNLCEKDAVKYGISLTIYVTGVVSLYLGMIIIIASRPFGLYKESKTNNIFSRGQLSADVAFFYNENEDIEKTNKSADFANPSAQPEIVRSNNKGNRLSNGNFASIIPRFSRKIPPGVTRDQGLVQTAFSQPLDSSKSDRTGQFVDNKVEQKRIVPTKTTLGYSQSPKTNPAARITNLKKQSVRADLVSFEVSTPVEALAMVRAELLKEFPTCHLSIKPDSKEEKLIAGVGVLDESASVTLVGTSVHHSHSNQVKAALSKAIRRCNGLLTSQTPGLIEFDHGLNTISQRILNLSRNESHAVALYKPEHRLMTQARDDGSYLPSGLGYTPDTGGVLELVDGLKNENLIIISNFFEDSNTANQLIKQGYSLEGLTQSYKHNFAADREKVSERLEKGTSENIALAVGIDKVLNETLQEDFTRFTENLGKNPTVSGDRAASELDASILRGTEVREHTNAIRAYLKKDTRTYANFKKAESSMLASVEQAYEFVETIGGKTDQTIKQDFVNENPKKSLSEAFGQARREQYFKQLLKKPASVVGYRLFIKNYKK